jgi:ATP-dependent Clp protease ATP-binding subunit ClpA
VVVALQRMGPVLQRVLDAAFKERDMMKDQFVSVEHLLLGLTQQVRPHAIKSCRK